MKGLYLLIDIIILLIPVLGSFYPRAPFRKEWKWALPAIAATTVGCYILDTQLSRADAFHFNENYIIGYCLFGIPIEHVISYFTMGYAAVFIYYWIKFIIPGTQLKYSSRIICGLLTMVSVIIALANYDRWLALSSFLGLATLTASFFLKKPYWLGQFIFTSISCAVLLIIVAGSLQFCGLDSGLIQYNQSEVVGQWVVNIPIDVLAWYTVVLGAMIGLYETIKSL